MISDILSKALDDMEPYLPSLPAKRDGFYEPAEQAMIDALRAHMRAVLRFLDSPPYDQSDLPTAEDVRGILTREQRGNCENQSEN